ncbi:MAG: phosphotransferase family protein [Deltaproteobacteria bacterium]|nr:phosphotransferase family protein [Deltaproteobacteria bacterium]
MALTPPDNTRPPRKAHEIDEAALGRWIAANVAGCAGATPIVRQFKGGQSNPTYWVGMGDVALVVRKKPPGDLLPSAHAVEREHRIIRALAGTPVPVPEALGLCEDASVIGTPFFVMRYVAGTIFWDPTLPELASNAARAHVYDAYIGSLAALHSVDYVKVGLGDYGKVGGYVARQVDRWSKQYEASRTSEIPAMESLMAFLRGTTPASDETTLIHGDYRIDNLMFEALGPAGAAKNEAPRALAIIDWELSTLGHPVSDLAYACMGYHLNLPGRGGLAGVDVKSLGIPTEQEMVDAYCAKTGRKSIADWPYFMAFGIFRLAAIAQGVYKRSLQGNASSEDAGGYGAAVTMLAELGCGIAGIGPRGA